MKKTLSLVLLTIFTITASTVSSLPVPAGYTRISSPAGSYGAWLSLLPLKNDKRILSFDGTTITNPFYHVFAVVALPLLFSSDLEQCADFSMRLWAEYHKDNATFDKMYLFTYSGSRRYFSESGKTYTSFLKWAMSNSNSYSVKTGCVPVPDADVRPGDMFVQNEHGGIGHVSVIMDMCEMTGKDRLYLVGYSFMPAQEFHIEYARETFGTGGWFTLDGYRRYLAEYLDLGKPVMRRFGE